jgi:hypothetical protein
VRLLDGVAQALELVGLAKHPPSVTLLLVDPIAARKPYTVSLLNGKIV